MACIDFIVGFTRWFRKVLSRCSFRTSSIWNVYPRRHVNFSRQTLANHASPSWVRCQFRADRNDHSFHFVDFLLGFQCLSIWKLSLQQNESQKFNVNTRWKLRKNSNEHELNMGCGTSVEDGDDSHGLSLGKSEKGELTVVKTLPISTNPAAISGKFW